MNWSEHLPALVIAIPLLGAFAAPLVSLGGKTLRNLLLIVVSFVTLAIAFLLWRSVLAHGTILYVMGGESFSLTLPSGFTFPVRILFEIDGVPEDVAKEALRLGAMKLPIMTRVVTRIPD